MAVHTTAFVARGHIGQTVGGLEYVAAPDMSPSRGIEQRALAVGAVDANFHGAQRRIGELLREPARDIDVAGLGQLFVQMTIVERGQGGGQPLLQLLDFASGKISPVGRDGALHAGREAMAMQAGRRVRWRVPGQLPRRLEGGRSSVKSLGIHLARSKQQTSRGGRRMGAFCL